MRRLLARGRVQTLVIYRRHVHVNYRELLVKLAAACGVYYGNEGRKKRSLTHAHVQGVFECAGDGGGVRRLQLFIKNEELVHIDGS